MPNGQQDLSPLEKAYQQAGGQIAPATPAPQPGQELSPLEQAYQQAPDYTPLDLTQPEQGQAFLVHGIPSGIAKGAAETAAGVAGLGAKLGLGTGALSQHLGQYAAARDPNQAIAAGQTFGAGAEDLAEFVLGDEALKGLALGDRLLQVGKIADYYEKASPFTKAAIEHSLNMVRRSGVGAAVGGVKEGKEGAITGAIGGAAAEPLEMAVRAAGRGAAGAVRGLRDVPEPGLPPGPGFAFADTTQQDAHAGLNKIADDIAQDLGVKRTTVGDPNDPRSPTATRNIYDDLSIHVEAASKAKFKPIDDATDGEFTKIDKALKENAQKLRSPASADPSVEARLMEQRAALRVRMDETVDLAKSKGVDVKLAEEGRELWKQKSTLEEVGAGVQHAMPGELQVKRPTIDLGKLSNRVQKMFDSGRLDDISHQRADDLLQQAYESQRQQELTEAARASQEEQMKAAAKVREEAQAKVERRRESLKTTAKIGAASAIGGAAGVKAVRAIGQLTQ